MDDPASIAERLEDWSRYTLLHLDKHPHPQSAYAELLRCELIEEASDGKTYILTQVGVPVHRYLEAHPHLAEWPGI